MTLQVGLCATFFPHTTPHKNGKPIYMIVNRPTIDTSNSAKRAYNTMSCCIGFSMRMQP